MHEVTLNSLLSIVNKMKRKLKREILPLCLLSYTPEGAVGFEPTTGRLIDEVTLFSLLQWFEEKSKKGNFTVLPVHYPPKILVGGVGVEPTLVVPKTK